MNTDMNGKKIKTICWITEEGDQVLNTGGKKTLIFSATYHGDKDEFWVVELDDGKEVARHNCRMITSIIWE